MKWPQGRSGYDTSISNNVCRSLLSINAVCRACKLATLCIYDS